MKQLNRKNTGLHFNRPLRVLQFGGGNFLRAFVDWMVEVLNEETSFNGGVAIIKPTARGDYSTLKSQEGLFTIVLKGKEQGKLVRHIKLVTCIQKVINPYGDWEDFLDLAKIDTLRFIVSNTTEAGIRFDPKDNLYDEPPGEFPAKLAIWLYHRFQHFNGDPEKGCILLPCELIEENGQVLKNTVLKYAGHWSLEPDFSRWIAESNHFCDTLVDRIVSGFPADEQGELQGSLNYDDRLMVAGEYYHSWVIGDHGAVRKELPFEKSGLNVEFVKDTAPYRERKVRILNGAHTVMVPLALLHGLQTVKEAMDNGFTGNFIRHAISEEVIPTLEMDQKALKTYAGTIFDRFGNPYIQHALKSIALNSIAKFRVRVLPVILDYRKKNNSLPVHLAFAFACLIRFYKGEWQGERLPVSDEPSKVSEMEAIWAIGEHAAIAEKVLGVAAYWGQDLRNVTGLPAALSLALDSLEHYGVKRGFDHFREHQS